MDAVQINQIDLGFLEERKTKKYCEWGTENEQKNT
jgi:hypothetical protein|nr:MAG TPA: hypothetical protein [Caudoviricetes sp.]